jgi:hypothetical protein
MSRIENAQETFISCEVGNARSRSQSGLAQQAGLYFVQFWLMSE